MRIWSIFRHRPPAYAVEVILAESNLRVTQARLGALSLAGARQLVPRGFQRMRAVRGRDPRHLVESWFPRRTAGC